MCGESRMHGVERGKVRRLYQRTTYRYRAQMRKAHKEATKKINKIEIGSQQMVTVSLKIKSNSDMTQQQARSADFGPS